MNIRTLLKTKINKLDKSIILGEFSFKYISKPIKIYKKGRYRSMLDFDCIIDIDKKIIFYDLPNLNSMKRFNLTIDDFINKEILPIIEDANKKLNCDFKVIQKRILN